MVVQVKALLHTACLKAMVSEPQACLKREKEQLVTSLHKGSSLYRNLSTGNLRLAQSCHVVRGGFLLRAKE